MVSLALIRELFDYNYWARDRQLAACKRVAREDFLRPLGSSFSSLRDTLAHLVGSEELWLERWRGGNPRGLPPIQDFRGLSAVQDRWASAERGMREYLAGLTQPKIEAPFTHINLRGEKRVYALWRSHLHLINHQTYHRGQVTTLLRFLGAASAAVDYYLFAPLLAVK